MPTTAGRKGDDFRVHRVPHLHVLDVAVFQDIPITIVPRILIDIAPATTPEHLARACHEAWVKHRTTPQQIEACIARNPRRHGIGKLRAAMGTDVLLSYRFHATRQAFENDVARRRRSSHIAYTYGDVLERPRATIADLRRRLDQAASD